MQDYSKLSNSIFLLKQVKYYVRISIKGIMEDVKFFYLQKNQELQK